MIRQSPIYIIILLVINIVAGLILSCYPQFNMILNCVVLCAALGIDYWTNKNEIIPAYKFSLIFIVPTITIIELIIGIFAPSQIQDNWGIIAILSCIAFQAMIVYSTILKSKKQTKKQI